MSSTVTLPLVWQWPVFVLHDSYIVISICYNFVIAHPKYTTALPSPLILLEPSMKHIQYDKIFCWVVPVMIQIQSNSNASSHNHGHHHYNPCPILCHTKVSKQEPPTISPGHNFFPWKIHSLFGAVFLIDDNECCFGGLIYHTEPLEGIESYTVIKIIAFLVDSYQK